MSFNLVQESVSNTNSDSDTRGRTHIEAALMHYLSNEVNLRNVRATANLLLQLQTRTIPVSCRASLIQETHSSPAQGESLLALSPTETSLVSNNIFSRDSNQSRNVSLPTLLSLTQRERVLSEESLLQYGSDLRVSTPSVGPAVNYHPGAGAVPIHALGNCLGSRGGHSSSGNGGDSLAVDQNETVTGMTAELGTRGSNTSVLVSEDRTESSNFTRISSENSDSTWTGYSNSTLESDQEEATASSSEEEETRPVSFLEACNELLNNSRQVKINFEEEPEEEFGVPELIDQMKALLELEENQLNILDLEREIGRLETEGHTHDYPGYLKKLYSFLEKKCAKLQINPKPFKFLVILQMICSFRTVDATTVLANVTAPSGSLAKAIPFLVCTGAGVAAYKLQPLIWGGGAGGRVSTTPGARLQKNPATFASAADRSLRSGGDPLHAVTSRQSLKGQSLTPSLPTTALKITYSDRASRGDPTKALRNGDLNDSGKFDEICKYEDFESGLKLNETNVEEALSAVRVRYRRSFRETLKGIENLHAGEVAKQGQGMNSPSAQVLEIQRSLAEGKKIVREGKFRSRSLEFKSGSNL